jgi:hypothetical protein
MIHRACFHYYVHREEVSEWWLEIEGAHRLIESQLHEGHLEHSLRFHELVQDGGTSTTELSVD